MTPIHDQDGKVTGAVVAFHDVTAARAKSLEMSHLAQHDALTDLPNRVLFNDRLTQAIALADRQGKQLAVLFVDLDWRQQRLSGSVSFAIGTEDLAQIDQIGRFASQTYGGGLRFQINTRQDVTGYASYQKRSQDRTDTSFGLSYGIHF